MISQYSNLYFPTCSVFVNLLLCILFFSKEKLKNIDNTSYSKLLVIGMLESVFMYITNLLVCLYYSPENFICFELLNKTLYSIYMVWLTIMFFYIFKIGSNEKEKLYKILCLILDIVLITLIFISPIELYYENNLTNSTGMSSNILYIGCSIYLVLMAIVSLYNYKKIKNKKKYLPLVILLVLMSTMMLIRMLDPLFNISSNVLSFVMLVMYFTIENPDVRIINELEFAKSQAEKANRAKTDFLSSMSHEIRTPLNAIVGLSEIIKTSKNIDEVHEDATDIVMASNTLLEIVNGILDISKIEADKMEIIETNYNPKEVFEDIVKLVSTRIGDKEIELRTSFGLDIPSAFCGDKGKIKQIITNLLTNAVKYTDKGYIDFKVQCINDLDISKLTITVSDTGRGIKKEQIDTLFNKFERLEEDKNTTLEGTGLGLAITKSLVEMMGGKIVVDSTYGEGSKFTVFLSQKIVNGEIREEEEEIVTYDGKKVLIVDDNKLNIKVATKILREFNLDIDEAISGFECIDKVNSNYYDIILMDIMMPKMGGVETLKRLKRIDNFNIPVVALTADVMNGRIDKYIEVGFNDYLAKPIEKKELKRVLKKVLDKKEIKQEIKDNSDIHQVIPITDKQIELLNKKIEGNEK